MAVLGVVSYPGSLVALRHLSGDTRDLETTQPRWGGGYNSIGTGSPELHPSTTETECDGAGQSPQHLGSRDQRSIRGHVVISRPAWAKAVGDCRTHFCSDRPTLSLSFLAASVKEVTWRACLA